MKHNAMPYHYEIHGRNCCAPFPGADLNDRKKLMAGSFDNGGNTDDTFDKYGNIIAVWFIKERNNRARHQAERLDISALKVPNAQQFS